MPPARAAPSALLVAASLAFVTTAQGGTTKPPPELSVLVLPSAPGASELALVTPGPVTDSGDVSRAARPLASVGAGACALWATRADWPSAKPPVVWPGSAAGFAVTGVSVLTVLGSALLAREQAPVVGVHALVVLGPGGAGVGVAAGF